MQSPCWLDRTWRRARNWIWKNCSLEIVAEKPPEEMTAHLSWAVTNCSEVFNPFLEKIVCYSSSVKITKFSKSQTLQTSLRGKEAFVFGLLQEALYLYLYLYHRAVFPEKKRGVCIWIDARGFPAQTPFILCLHHHSGRKFDFDGKFKKEKENKLESISFV